MEIQEVTVRSVDRALAILECFSQDHYMLSLSQIANAVRLPVTTTLRLLTTLEQNFFIQKDTTTGMYSLGWKLAKLGNITFAGLDVCAKSYPVIERLQNIYNESFGLYVQEGFSRICVARIDSTRSFRQCVNIGSTRPLDSGASGHVLVAYGNTPECLKLRESSPICTPELLNRVRKEGYSYSFGEYLKGITSVAAPVFNVYGNIEAALFVTGPAVRMDSQIDFFAKILKESAASISQRMGYSGEYISIQS